MKAADGVTDLYGVMYKPYDLIRRKYILLSIMFIRDLR